MNVQEKKKNINSYYFPFLAITLGFIIVYSYLNWYFLIRPQSAFLTTDLSNYWLPFSLPIIPVFIFFSLKLRKVKPGLNFLILVSLISSICIAPAAIIAQFYINTAAGRISELNNIREAGQNIESRYFTIKNVYVSKSHAGILSRERSASRTSWDFEIFICCPLMEKPADTLQDHIDTWLVKHYYTNFGEGSGGDISKKERLFEEESLDHFQRSNLETFEYLGRIDHDDEYKTYIDAAKLSIKFNSSGDNQFFESFDKPYSSRNRHKAFWFCFAFIAGQFAFFLMVKYILPKL